MGKSRWMFSSKDHVNEGLSNSPSYTSLPSTPQRKLLSVKSFSLRSSEAEQHLEPPGRSASVFATPRGRSLLSKKFAQSRSSTISSIDPTVAMIISSPRTPMDPVKVDRIESNDRICDKCIDSRQCPDRRHWLTRTWAELSDLTVSSQWATSGPNSISYKPLAGSEDFNDSGSSESVDPWTTPRDDILSVCSDAYSPSSTSSRASIFLPHLNDVSGAGGEKALVQLIHLCNEKNVRMSYNNDLTGYFGKIREKGDIHSQTPQKILWFRYLSRYVVKKERNSMSSMLM